MERVPEVAENLQQYFSERDFLHLPGGDHTQAKGPLTKLFRIAANHALLRDRERSKQGEDKRQEFIREGRNILVARSAIEDIVENWNVNYGRHVHGIGERSVTLLRQLLRPEPAVFVSEDDIQTVANRHMKTPSQGMGHRVVSSLADYVTFYSNRRKELSHLILTEGRQQKIDTRLLEIIVKERARPPRLGKVGTQVVRLAYEEFRQNPLQPQPEEL